MIPTLILTAHGTRDPHGRAMVQRIARDVRLAVPHVEVRSAYVDVQKPAVADVLDRVAAEGRRAVVVPLLLSAGVHVHRDIAEAADGRPGVAVADALGPDDRLARIVVDRLREAQLPAGSHVVLAPAGSSDPRSQQDARDMAERVARLMGTRVEHGCVAGPDVSIADAVAQAHRRDPDRSVAVLSYLLAPGFFQHRLESTFPGIVTAPIGAHPALIEIVVERYLEAANRLGPVQSAPAATGVA